MVATIDELRELSRRSLLTYRVAMLAMVGMLALVAFATRSMLATLAGGALVVTVAFVMGQERGAFRKVMRDAKKRRAAVKAAVVVEVRA